MGKGKKRFNWKARQVVEAVIDKSEQNKIKLDASFEGSTSVDDCNALVLPSSKRNVKIKKSSVVSNKRILSKSERRRLEQIVSRKKKKEKRASVLEALSKVQAPPEELEKLTSLASVQTKGLKRRWGEQELESFENTLTEPKEKSTINSKVGKRRRRLLLLQDSEKKRLDDPNVVGFNESSSDSDDQVEPMSDEPPAICVDSDSEEEAKSNPPSPIPDASDKPITDHSQAPNQSNLNNQDSCTKSVACKKPVVKSEPAVFIPVQRSKEIQEARLKLPILAEEQVIMETISENRVIVIAGETGSGKTTQVPQFLYEAGYARTSMIGVTEPRRVAAISMAQRVGQELNLGSDKVSYLIRFEGNATPETQIKFMTDGVLLKEIETDFLLTKYSVIILDEAHERSVYTDILIGLLSRIVPLRYKKGNPLKLIIMSATLRIEDFTKNSQLFKNPPPVVKVDTRQYPVTIHFNKRTNPDYLKESFKKICRIHTQLPEGGILVFLTGQQEVNTLVKRLRKTFPFKSKSTDIETEDKSDKENEEASEDIRIEKVLEITKKKNKAHKVLPDITLDSYDVTPADDTEGDLLEDLDEEEWSEDCLPVQGQPLWVLPLYSLMASHKQAKVFQPPPEGTRLCVVATNIAETSLTIPGIKYVVDCGKTKTKLYDKVTGVTAYSVVWTSKASANQRAGRAGRTSPGHCYRLYSSAVFNDDFEEWTMPEIQRRGVDDLMLQMKALGIDRVVNFPFPSPPDSTQLEQAERRLTLLGALQAPTGEPGMAAKLTPLGKSMAAFPVAPRYSKMLCLGHQHNLLEYLVAIVAASSVQEVLIGGDDNTKKTIWRQWAGQGESLLLGDLMVLLRAVGGAEFANSERKLAEFCINHGLREKAVIEIRKLRKQLTQAINLVKPELELQVNPQMAPPSIEQIKLLRQVVLSGMVDHVARKSDVDNQNSGKKRAVYHTPEMEADVFLHSHSALYKSEPEWVVYQEIYEAHGTTFMRGVTAIEPEWLPVFALPLCNLSTPLEDPPPSYDPSSQKIYCHVKGTFGKSGWPLPTVKIEFPPGIDKYKWLAIFFLDGSICESLKKFVPSLLSAPQTMIRSWAKLQPRTEYLLKTLVSKEVDTPCKLLDYWNQNSQFLLKAYQMWLPESAHNDVASLWPPC